MSDGQSMTFGQSTITAEDVDAALAKVVESVQSSGQLVSTSSNDNPDIKAVDSNEILALTTVVTNSRARITVNPARRLNVVGAVARFVWMVSGNDRLEDIAYYEPKVRGYTDNKLSVPGSNYGMRLFQPRPGLNQIEAVVGRLLQETGSRRAAAVIWSPDDAVRVSNDIPCAFGAFYHVRDGQLIATTIMRSNNAVTLLPFNVFEFSLIAEMIAHSADVELGPYIHFAASMHVYERERELAEKIVRAYRGTDGPPHSMLMPLMPRNPKPLIQANLLAQFEAKLRHDHATLSDGDPNILLRQAAEALDPYWLEFYRVLVAYAFAKAGHYDSAEAVADKLAPHFRPSVFAAVQKMRPNRESGLAQLDLGFELIGSDTTAGLSSAIAEVFAPDTAEVQKMLDELDHHCDLISTETETEVTRQEFNELRRQFAGVRFALAARSPDKTEQGGSEARLSISKAEVKKELDRIRQNMGG